VDVALTDGRQRAQADRQGAHRGSEQGRDPEYTDGDRGILEGDILVAEDAVQEIHRGVSTGMF
jgi:hypothetical protein